MHQLLLLQLMAKLREPAPHTARSFSPLIASAPKSVAEKDDREPWNEPIGVRTAAAMHTSAGQNPMQQHPQA